VFHSPRQTRHAVATCAAWLGVQTLAQVEVVPASWLGDDRAAAVSM
jgi:hypothetical protein